MGAKLHAELADRLRTSRELAGLTPDELDEKAMLPRGTIAGIEHGIGPVSWFECACIARALDVNAMWLGKGDRYARNSF